ncbi:MAG: DUF2892 domain-containing protein [Chlorobi bacterium]|nr:DUF2892 domain-containing protein [Chlorobiota bacterium]
MCNVGGIDRWLRIILGLILIGVGYYLEKNWIVIGIGVILLLTGIIKFCLIYKILGISTCPNKS